MFGLFRVAGFYLFGGRVRGVVTDLVVSGLGLRFSDLRMWNARKLRNANREVIEKTALWAAQP